MVRKRLICFLAIFALLFTAVPFAAVSVYAEPDDSGVTDPIPGGNEGEEPGGGEDPEEPSVPTVPFVEIVGSTIKRSNDFFELGVKINPPAEGFLTAGVVLQYDSSLIVPATWDDENPAIDMSDRTDWRNVVVLPAVSPKELSGKMAFAYQEKQEAENPDTPEPPTPPDPENPDDNQGGEPAGQAEGEDTEGENPTDPTDPTDPTQPTEPEEPTAYASKGYLCLSGEAALPIKTMPDGGRIVTVRFRYAGDDKDAKAAVKQKVIDGFEAGNIVTLAPDSIAAASHIGQSLTYCASEDIENDSFYYTTVDTSADPPEVSEGITTGKLLTKEQAYKLTLIQDGETVNSGGSDPSKFAALVFFDWDEKTLLGSVVVDGSASEEEINEQLNAFNKTLMPVGFELPTAADVLPADYDPANADGMTPDDPGYNPNKAGEPFVTYKDASGNAIKEYVSVGDGTTYKSIEKKLEEVTEYNADYPLTNKKGYTFGKWIDFDSEAYTVYGNLVSASNADNMVYEIIDEPLDLSNVAKGKILKAAYIANDLMKPEDLSTASIRTYTISNDDNPDDGDGVYDINDGYFGRFGSSGNYAVRAKVTRVNSADTPVYRTRETAIKALFNIEGGTQIYSLAKLENLDEQIVEIVAPENATSVSLIVIDIAGVSDWIGGAGARSDEKFIASSDFVFQGKLVFLNEYPDTVKNDAGEFDGNFPAANNIFTEVDLDISVVADLGLGYSGTGAAARRRRAVVNIDYCRKQKLNETGKKYLTQSELQNAITYGNYKGNV